MARRRRKVAVDFSVDPETRKGVGIVFLFAFSVLMLLGIFGLAGALGQALDAAVSYVFGWDRLLLPFFLIAWAYHILAPERLPLKFSNTIGFLLFFLTLNPLVHAVTFAGNLQVGEAALQTAGGKLGEVISIPLVNMLGMAGAATILSAIFVMALLLMFNATLRQVLFVLDITWKALAVFARGLLMPIRRLMEKRNQSKPLALHEIEGEDEEDEEEEEGEFSEGEYFEEDEEEEEDSDEEDAQPARPKKRKRRYPKIDIPFDLLDRRDQRPTSGDILHNREVIRRTFETFGINVEMSEVAVGPTVTQFALKPAEGVKLSRITGLHNDLALSLAAHPIRIEAPIPGKSLVGVEVPNQSVATVGLREMLETKEFRDSKGMLSFVLGKDVAGKPWVSDLAKMPHLLVAGATGSGKSVCLNTIIMSFLYTRSPDEVKFIMVDPKRVELQVYNGIPHLVTPVITRVPETVNALKWALREMDRRYDLLAKFGSRDLSTYNGRVEEKLPYLIIFIDELADLMATSASEVEGPIVRLAQMSRAVGIHLVLATQRPSVDVITGLIKANIPGRIAFSVASTTDSRTILDQQGAEKLLGRGDMLYSTAEMAMLKRIQGSFVSEPEIQRVVEFIKSTYEPADYDHSITEKQGAGGTRFSGGGGLDGDADTDPLLSDAKDEILRAGKASASLLQRRLKVGYARAARILDILEEEGFIGPSDGAKPREILQTERDIEDEEEMEDEEEGEYEDTEEGAEDEEEGEY
ncbi:cell division protein FtsK [Candidatus Uhrbacteria bacterium CG22_combo_CG10-13_8_21_14_all_47_17]|uniref:Cell division protein FtsK n=1 Tax=Candidatus Uhrbacteria bacterium CG22_combo_CG10-13_8_21_14_all_47_17 TaxID=1975041 RepID=A0A2H0BR85_9BACT|nr:MAG: cell division protein FtsK [Candidatus Uhrbacteria bacterium CG22_combo_CG10-13_8_21_14_all_47_17]